MNPEPDRFEALAAEARRVHRAAKRQARSAVGSEAAYHLANQGVNLPSRLFFTATNPAVGGVMSAVASGVQLATDHFGYRSMLSGETATHERDLHAQAGLARIANTLMMTAENADRLMRAGTPTPSASRFVPDPAEPAARAARERQARHEARAFLGSELRAQALGQLFSAPANLAYLALNPMVAAVGIAVRSAGQAVAEHIGYQRTLGKLSRAAAGDLANHATADVIAAESGRLADVVRDLGGRQAAPPAERRASRPEDEAQAAKEARPSLRNRITGLFTSSLLHDIPARVAGVAVTFGTLGVAAAVNSAATSAVFSVTQFGFDLAAGWQSTKRAAWVRAGDIAVDNRVAELAQRVSGLSAELGELARPAAPFAHPTERAVQDARAALRPVPGPRP